MLDPTLLIGCLSEIKDKKITNNKNSYELCFCINLSLYLQFFNMKVVFVCPKYSIPEELINKLKEHTEVYFFEDNPIDIKNISLLKEKGDKILCPFPEPMMWKFPNEFIKDIPNLKAICLSTTSYHWIDGKLARSLGIHLTNIPNPLMA